MQEHNTLSGDQLHEPKGVETATNNQVYISDGAGSGSWTDFTTTQDTLVLNIKIDDLSVAGTYWAVSPVAGTLAKISVVLYGNVGTTSPVITTEIDDVVVTGGNVSFIPAITSPGRVMVNSPTANNIISLNEAIEIICDGGATNAVSADVSLHIVSS